MKLFVNHIDYLADLASSNYHMFPNPKKTFCDKEKHEELPEKS